MVGLGPRALRLSGGPQTLDPPGRVLMCWGSYRIEFLPLALVFFLSMLLINFNAFDLSTLIDCLALDSCASEGHTLQREINSDRPNSISPNPNFSLETGYELRSSRYQTYRLDNNLWMAYIVDLELELEEIGEK